MNRKAILIGIILLGTSAEALSQSFFTVRRDRHTIVSFGTGTSTYFGELNNPGDYIDAKPSFNVGLQLFPLPAFIGNRMSVRAELTWFRLQGTDEKADSDRRERNLSFFSNNMEFNAVGLFHLLPQDRRFYQRSSFNIYGFYGIGLLYMNPKAVYQGENIALQPLQTEGVAYSRFQPVVPYGLGLKFKAGPFLNIAVEGGWRLTFTDYLDDVSIRNYPDPSILQSDLARALSDRRREIDPDYPLPPGVGRRGNPERNDAYMLLNIKVEWYMPYDLFNSSDRSKLMNKRRPSAPKRR